MNDRDKVKMQGLMDRRVERWKVHTPASHVIGQGASRVTLGEVEGVAIQENVRYEVAGSDDARVNDLGSGVVGAEVACQVNHGLTQPSRVVNAGRETKQAGPLVGHAGSLDEPVEVGGSSSGPAMV